MFQITYLRCFFFFFLFLFTLPAPVYTQDSLLLTKDGKIDTIAIIKKLEQKDFYGNKIVYVPLETLLQYAIAFLKNIQIANLNKKIAESKYQQNFTPFEPKLTTSLKNENSLTLKNISKTKTTFAIPNSSNFSSNFAKKTTSGISYTIGINAINTNTNNYILDNDSADVSAEGETKISLLNANLAIDIPLFQNLGSVNTANLRKSFIEIKDKEKELLQTLLGFFQNFTSIYWELKRVYAMYEVQYEKTILSEKLYQESELLHKNGAGDAIKVVLNLNNYQKDKIALNNIWNVIFDLNEQIKDALELPDLALFLYPADDFQLSTIANTPEKYLQQMMENHPTFLALEIDKQKNKITAQENDNANKADIDLNLKYTWQGAGLTPQQAADTFATTKLDNYSFGITWVYTFGNQGAKSKKNETLYQELKLAKEFAIAKSDALLSIKKRIRDLKNKKAEVELLKQNIVIVEEIFRREKFKYENGSSTSLALQEIQTELVTSKFNLSAAQASYEITYSAMLIDTGEIFEAYNIPITQVKATQ